jgi:hypothetical protein
MIDNHEQRDVVAGLIDGDAMKKIRGAQIEY